MTARRTADWTRALVVQLRGDEVGLSLLYALLSVFDSTLCPLVPPPSAAGLDMAAAPVRTQPVPSADEPPPWTDADYATSRMTKRGAERATATLARRPPPS